MYCGFALDDVKFPDGSYEVGATLHSKHKQRVQAVLHGFVNSDGTLNASKMQANWFPTVKADIFISHAHKDSKTAVAFAGWMKKEFDLVSFIDSCAWGYSDDLLQQLDRTYCRIPNTTNYYYDKRNRSTSHVHMMLSTALSKMIDS